MQGDNQNNITPTNNNVVSPQIVQTDIGSKDGQDKCPKCGATDISLNTNNGHLRCNFCRHEFEPEKVSALHTDIKNLSGQVMGSGATNIVADTNDVVTFKCSSCGAEVVIDTASSLQARCHWCRNTLSVNQQIPNGSIPDLVLPFNINRDTAKGIIEDFVGKRKFFAHPKFREEFKADNIMGVYFPYMLVDVNSHVRLVGQGEHLVKSYVRGSGDNKKIYYDADLYDVERDFDLMINDLSIESSKDKLDKNNKTKTTNIINAIMPFDTENAVKYNANYLKGYTSERRDTNVEDLRSIVEVQSKDIAKFAANDTLKHYDRGVAWSNQELNVKGQQWKAAYLPVWLYSYQQVNGDKKLLHYVAVNARTKEVMGSVPLHMPKLLLVSFLIELLSFGAMYFIRFDNNYILLSIGVIFFIVMYLRYRNKDARHAYEKETKTQMENLVSVDNFVVRRTGLTNSRIISSNNTTVTGQSFSSQMLNSLNSVVDQNKVASLIKNNIDKGGK